MLVDEGVQHPASSVHRYKSAPPLLLFGAQLLVCSCKMAKLGVATLLGYFDYVISNM
jgi:hypothetical protein